MTVQLFETPEDVIKHYGVLGMKWGKRSSSAKDSKKVVVRAAPKAADAKEANAFKAKAKTKGTDSLSNAELQKLVNRMNLEQQYSKLVTPTANSSAAKKFIKDNGKQVVADLAKQYAKEGIKKGVKLALDSALKR